MCSPPPPEFSFGYHPMLTSSSTKSIITDNSLKRSDRKKESPHQFFYEQKKTPLPESTLLAYNQFFFFRIYIYNFMPEYFAKE